MRDLYIDQGYTTIKHIALTLADALQSDNVEVRSERITAILNRVVDSYDEVVPVVTHNGHAVYDWTLLWLVMTDLIDGIAVQLGYGGEDDWYFDNLPTTSKVITRSRIATVEHMQSAFKQATGHNESLGILLNSFIEGEPSDQSHARLHARSNGLQPV